ncbi:MAG: SDR family oxidoreductase [Desulfobacterales bacterium]|nr:SDR family oxidoreductase [Desulfobacterales bacterium]
MNLNGKTALVLGAIQGIGRGIGMALAEAGAAVVLTHFDWEESLEECRKAFASYGNRCLMLRTDLRDELQVADLMARVADRFGRLDILVNNIERGGWPVVHGPYVQQQWDLEMATTLRAKWLVFNAALPLLKASGNAAVINLSSIAALVGRSGPAGLVFNDGYAAANRGVSLLTETWARMGAPEVRVNEIMLGFVETRHGPGTRGWGLLDCAQQRALTDHTLLGRVGRLDDVVRAVTFLVDSAPFMTGSVLRLDGGYVLGGEAMAPMPEGVV